MKSRNPSKFVYLLILCTCMFLLLFSSCDLAFLKTIKVIYHGTGATEGYPPYDSNEYTTGDSIIVKENLGNLARAGYKFQGWRDISKDHYHEYHHRSVIVAGNADIHLHPIWIELPDCTISFNTNQGSYIESKQVKHGFLLVAPENPTRSGYGFEGWYTDSDLSQPYDFDQAVVADVTLYAKWESKVVYEILFDSMGGTEVPKIIAEENQRISPPTSPEKVGYTFAGWFKDTLPEIPWDFQQDVVNSSLTLYAKWKQIIEEDDIDPILRFTLRTDDTFEVFADASNDTQTIVIPAFYKGKRVTAISKHGFEGFPFLESVQLPESLVAIGDFAFSNCRNLKSINTPSELQDVGMGAFSGCSNLTDNMK